MRWDSLFGYHTYGWFFIICKKLGCLPNFTLRIVTEEENIKSLTAMVSLVDEDKERNFLFNLQPKESIGRNMQRLLCETTQDLTDEIVRLAPSGRKRELGALMIIKLLRRF